jgi:signal transduction histidine kinase
LQGKNWAGITHPDDVRNDQLNAQTMLEGKTDRCRWEKRYVRKDGSIVYADVSSVLYHGQGNVPKYFITTVHDITQRKRMEKELQQSFAKFSSLFNSMEEGVALHELILDDTNNPVDYRILDVNPAFTAHTGIGKTDAIEKSAIELYGPPPPFLDKYAEVAVTGKSMSFEVFYDKMNKHFFISVSSPAQNQFVTIFQDITARKRYEQILQEREEKIRELNHGLEKRVMDRTAELSSANRELEAFAYTVSHDLRAPVRAIGGFTKILEQEYFSRLDEEGQRLFRIILDNTSRMDKLIDDLLAFSRLSRTDLNLSSISMPDIIWKCYGELTQNKPGVKPMLRLGDLPLVRGDYAMLVQVWTNLLSNAIKFTEHCENPEISIGCNRQGHEHVFSISDNGTGFDMKYADKLFGVFQRLHSVKEYEGTGVGLAIVQRIIHRHKGRIWAEGELRKGATFSFTLMP